MLTVDNFKATGDVRKDYHAQSEIVVNRFIERSIVRTIGSRCTTGSDGQSIITHHHDNMESSEEQNDSATEAAPTLTLNAAAEHFGEYRNELMEGTVNYVDRRELTAEMESKIDSAIEDSESDYDDDDYDDDGSDQSDEDDDYRERIARKLKRAEERRQARQMRFSTDAHGTGNPRKIIMAHQLSVLDEQELSKVKTEVYISSPEHRLEYVDMYCFSRALETISFPLVQLK